MVEQIVQGIIARGWCYYPHVLNLSDLDKMSSLFKRDFSPARVGSSDNRQRQESIRGDWILWLDPLSPTPEIRGPIDFLSKLMLQLNRDLFLCLKQFECHLAKYPVGSFYRRHYDKHTEGSSRVFTFIFYVHEQWSESDGGELVIYDKNNELITKISPMSGSFVGFLSDQFPHEVLPAQRERRSLTGWMHDKLLY
jgi:SM-20-related protein